MVGALPPLATKAGSKFAEVVQGGWFTRKGVRSSTTEPVPAWLHSSVAVWPHIQLTLTSAMRSIASQTGEATDATQP